MENMVLSSLRGSTFIAILIGAGATLQSVQTLIVYLVREPVVLGPDLGKRMRRRPGADRADRRVLDHLLAAEAGPLPHGARLSRSARDFRRAALGFAVFPLPSMV